MFYSQGCPLLLFPNAKLQFFPKISKRKIKKTSLQLHSNYHTKTDKNILTKAFPKSLSSSSYAPPLCLVTKLDDNTIIIPLSIIVSSSLVRRIIGGTREEETRHFLGKIKKNVVFFGEERKNFRSVLPSKILHRYTIVSMEYLWRTDGLSMEYPLTFKRKLTLLFNNNMACRYKP